MKHELTAKRLKEAMSDCNMSARELAHNAAINESSISQYVTGRNIPGNINSGKIGKVLGVNPVWLMGFDVPKHINQTEAMFLTVQEKELIEALRKLSSNQKSLIYKMLDIERNDQ